MQSRPMLLAPTQLAASRMTAGTRCVTYFIRHSGRVHWVVVRKREKRLICVYRMGLGSGLDYARDKRLRISDIDHNKSQRCC
ncbi:hypothetical protein NDU88_006443 [Pleurodeles waltl]|uniref:Secreted protein n=1 Tax=Pleurodeles waltl TaxID=8319 RepID=A0AAV7UMS5_PLEWA|nr:hypothetical protein NDU88_006443 [Pleurodeles waltl]